MIAGSTEESIFAALGLPFVDPEFRESFNRYTTMDKQQLEQEA